MYRSLLMLHVTVKDGERALLTRNGRLERVLDPGRHRLFDPRRELAVEVLQVVRAEFPSERHAVLKAARPDLAAALFEAVETKADQLAIVTLDGRPSHLMAPWQTRVFWKVATKVDAERIDVTSDPRIDQRHLKMVARERNIYVTEIVVENHEAGLLLSTAPSSSGCRRPARLLDGRPHDRDPSASTRGRRPVEVTAQEMLTKDRIGMRVTLTAFTGRSTRRRRRWRRGRCQHALPARAVRDPRGGGDAYAGRDPGGTRHYRPRGPCVRDGSARPIWASRSARLGVKDVILPGDVRELLNKVVEAERTAKANLIRRQEETAATRSLLNTARLMEDNPLLLRLKELEALEQLVEKVGRIDLHAGEGRGLDALLTGLVRMKANEPA